MSEAIQPELIERFAEGKRFQKERREGERGNKEGCFCTDGKECLFGL